MTKLLLWPLLSYINWLNAFTTSLCGIHYKDKGFGVKDFISPKMVKELSQSLCSNFERSIKEKADEYDS